MATDEVTDMIASITVQRQATEKETGSAAACAVALRRLEELLDRETEALRLHGPDTDRPANIDAVTIAISKLKKLAGATSRLSIPERTNRGPREVPRRDAPRHPVRNRGRRTMGRSGGR
ncbi:MAG: hypothetical protein HYY79_03510 [Betaproteobacteria bacterium]|nr:hypothetical protein [Betaproteobacteria bacterium]